MNRTARARSTVSKVNTDVTMILEKGEGGEVVHVGEPCTCRAHPARSSISAWVHSAHSTPRPLGLWDRHARWSQVLRCRGSHLVPGVVGYARKQPKHAPRRLWDMRGTQELPELGAERKEETI